MWALKGVKIHIVAGKLRLRTCRFLEVVGVKGIHFQSLHLWIDCGWYGLPQGVVKLSVKHGNRVNYPRCWIVWCKFHEDSQGGITPWRYQQFNSGTCVTPVVRARIWWQFQIEQHVDCWCQVWSKPLKLRKSLNCSAGTAIFLAIPSEKAEFEWTKNGDYDNFLGSTCSNKQISNCKLHQ